MKVRIGYKEDLFPRDSFFSDVFLLKNGNIQVHTGHHMAILQFTSIEELYKAFNVETDNPDFELLKSYLELKNEVKRKEIEKVETERPFSQMTIREGMVWEMCKDLKHQPIEGIINRVDKILDLLKNAK